MTQLRLANANSAFSFRVAKFSRKLRFGVVGPYGSGKTTFIKAVSETCMTISRLMNFGDLSYDSTLCFDHGIRYFDLNLKPIDLSEAKRIVLEGNPRHVLRVDLWGCAGQLRFRPIREALIYRKCDGIFFVVDLSRPNTIDDAQQLYVEVLKFIPEVHKSVPFILVQNKDDKRLMSYRVYPRELMLPENTPNYIISALYKKGIWEPFLHMIKLLSHRI